MPLLLALPLILILIGCATGGAAGLQDDQQRSTVSISGSDFTYQVELTEEARRSAAEFPGDPATAWRVLPAIYEALGIPLRTIRPDVRLLGTERWTVPFRVAGSSRSAFLDCGRSLGGNNADLYRVSATVHSQVHPSGENVRLETIVTASARPRDVSGNAVGCTSTGRLEAVIASMLRQRLAAGASLADVSY